jgi:hypothetical protein
VTEAVQTSGTAAGWDSVRGLQRNASTREPHSRRPSRDEGAVVAATAAAGSAGERIEVARVVRNLGGTPLHENTRHEHPDTGSRCKPSSHSSWGAPLVQLSFSSRSLCCSSSCRGRVQHRRAGPTPLTAVTSSRSSLLAESQRPCFQSAASYLLPSALSHVPGRGSVVQEGIHFTVSACVACDVAGVDRARSALLSASLPSLQRRIDLIRRVRERASERDHTPDQAGAFQLNIGRGGPAARFHPLELHGITACRGSRRTREVPRAASEMLTTRHAAGPGCARGESLGACPD